mgnify:FL=1
MTPAFSVILVNYNAGNELYRSLQSVVDELHGVPWEGVVIDNNSTDSSADVALEFAPNFSLIRNDENIGFSRGVNQGLAATLAPLVLILNPDCRLMAGAITGLNFELEEYQNCAIAGPKILNPDGSVQGTARGDPNMWTGLFGRTTFLRRVLPWLPVSKRNVVAASTNRNNQPSVIVDWISGACMLARRDALATVGGFDERYFLYWEDADLCRRLRATGNHVRYVQSATAIHRVGQSSRTARADVVRAFHASAFLYYSTHVASKPLYLNRLLARLMLQVRCFLVLTRQRFRRS